MALRAIANLAVLVAGLAAAAPASAQPYPAKPVRAVIVWPPGGSNDVIGRIAMQGLTDALGQQFVVDNRGGAAGTMGAEYVARSAADGYTLMIHSATHVANPHLYRKLPYETLRDFAAVAPLASQLGSLLVHPSLPARSVRDLVALAKARPDEIVYGSAGNGSFVHLTMVMFNALSGTRMVHVPYKGGGPAVIALMSGEIQAIIASSGSVVSQLATGKVRPLAVTSAARSALFPALPTIAESGVPGYEFTAWIGVFAPARTPRAVVERLNGEIRKVLESPEIARQFAAQTHDPLYLAPDAFEARVRRDYDKYAEVIRLTGARID